jgi:hypothetical protein
MSAAQSSQITPSSFNIIRFALLGGVLFLGAIAWFLSRDGDFGALDEETATVFRYAFYAVFTASALGMLFVHRSLPQAETFQQRATRCILGFALAEGTALFGGVYLLLTGSAMLYVIGLVLFLIAFMVFSPIERM